jgi:hypothetical protein
MNGAVRDELFGFGGIGGHMRRSGVRLERVHTRPFFDHHKRVRAILRLKWRWVRAINSGTVFNATDFCAHSRHIGVEGLEHLSALTGFRGDNSKNMDHDVGLS